MGTKCGGEDEATSGIISLQNVKDIDWSKIRITGKLWALCTIRFDSIFHSRTSLHNGHFLLVDSPYIDSCFKSLYNGHPFTTVTFFLSPRWPLWRGFGSGGSSEIARASPALSSRIRDRNELTEKIWENAAQGLGKRGSSVILKRR